MKFFISLLSEGIILHNLYNIWKVGYALLIDLSLQDEHNEFIDTDYLYDNGIIYIYIFFFRNTFKRTKLGKTRYNNWIKIWTDRGKSSVRSIVKLREDSSPFKL